MEQRNDPLDSVRRFLRLNGLHDVTENRFINDKCEVVINMKYENFDIYFLNADLDEEPASMSSDDFNIYWLVGILTWYNLIDRNYKSL